MKTFTAAELESRALNDYNDHPPGWRYVFTIGKNGEVSVGFMNSKLGKQYWLKPVSPYSSRKVGFEGTFNESFPFLDDTNYSSDFGVRFVDITDEEKRSMADRGRMIGSVAEKYEKALRSKPVPIEDRKGRGAVIGPTFSMAALTLADISPAQRELEEKMKEEITRLNKASTGFYTV